MPHASTEQLHAIVSLLGRIEARRRGIPLLTIDRLEASHLINALTAEHDPKILSDATVREEITDLIDRLTATADLAKRLTARLTTITELNKHLTDQSAALLRLVNREATP